MPGDQKPRPISQVGAAWELGPVLGIGIGVALGVALGNTALGIGMGIGIGVALAIAFGATANRAGCRIRRRYGRLSRCRSRHP
ncbi:hypothetical protein J7E29_09160 [Streptomyces sp. ISL-90]|nr:hypothetical protein [Streptomyces sp. ISL-90]